MGKFEDMQKSSFGKTGIDYQNQALSDWANQRQGALDGRGFFSSLVNWPMDKFQDYKINRALKFNPDANSKRNALLKEVEAMYGDKLIDDNEKKSDAYYNWQMLLKGQGLK